MSEVRKGTSRNTENENKRCKIFNKVLNLNWDYVRVKKNQKENKNHISNKNNNGRLRMNDLRLFEILVISCSKIT
jgi:hypothetical protein